MTSQLLTPNPVYKPFRFPWAYEAWKTQQQIHWIADEIPMAEDVRDWQTGLNDAERNLLTQIFRFFTQADVEVQNCYQAHYSRVFQPTEIKMMLTAFSNMETIHIDAYSHLISTVGMPDVEYSAFLRYKELKDKYDYMQQFGTDTLEDIAITLATFGAFTEGLQLFASFAMLMNFPRHNKMKGMGQVVTWSVRDETLHTQSIIRLFHEFIREHPHLWTDELKEKLGRICHEIVSHEDAFIDLAFELGAIEGLTPAEVKQYVRYIANRRLTQLSLPAMYSVTENPLPWMDDLLHTVEHSNFFEARATEYSKAATKGDWDDAF